MLPNFSLVRPTTVGDAARLLSYESAPYVGGTELLLAMKMGLLQPSTLVDLKRIPELQTIEMRNHELVIGAAVTHYWIAKHPLVAEHAPLLAEVERNVGNARVRAAGSIGGNLCFAEPKSDIATTLVALDATVTLESPRGSRRLSVDEFTLCPYTTAREDDELLTAVHVPLDPSRRGVYLKYQTMERPTVGVALVARGNTRRLVVGAVGGRPMRFDFSQDERIVPQQIADTVEAIPDLTGSELYKRHIVAVYVQKALDQMERAS